MCVILVPSVATDDPVSEDNGGGLSSVGLKAIVEQNILPPARASLRRARNGYAIDDVLAQAEPDIAVRA